MQVFGARRAACSKINLQRSEMDFSSPKMTSGFWRPAFVRTMTPQSGHPKSFKACSIKGFRLSFSSRLLSLEEKLTPAFRGQDQIASGQGQEAGQHGSFGLYLIPGNLDENFIPGSQLFGRRSV